MATKKPTKKPTKIKYHSARDKYTDETKRRQDEIKQQLKEAKIVDGVYYIKPYAL
jgi:hypothetical protein